MNKPELIKRIAIQMTHHYSCGLLSDTIDVGLPLGSILPTQKVIDCASKNSHYPDNYEIFIPQAEIFVEKLITDKVIQNE